MLRGHHRAARLTVILLSIGGLGLLSGRVAAGPRGELGLASYYGSDFDNQKTASGERFALEKMTAAHRTLPFGTRVRVTNVQNGRSVVVRINDRGPFVKGRVLDLSHAAARQIGLIGAGVGRVRFHVLSPRPNSATGNRLLAHGGSTRVRRANLDRLWRRTHLAWSPASLDHTRLRG